MSLVVGCVSTKHVYVHSCKCGDCMLSLNVSWIWGQGTAVAWCYQTRMGGIPVDLESHRLVLSQSILHIQDHRIF